MKNYIKLKQELSLWLSQVEHKADCPSANKFGEYSDEELVFEDPVSIAFIFSTFPPKNVSR